MQQDRIRAKRGTRAAADPDDGSTGARANLGETAYLTLYRKIIDLSLHPGSTVSEPELSTMLGLTRASIRSAMLRLSQEKLVTPIVRQGYLISPLTIKDSLDIAQIRLLVEPHVAFLAAGRLTHDDFLPFKKAYSTGYSDEASLDRFLKANRALKLMLAKATGNERFEKMMAEIVDAVERYTRLSFMTLPNMSPSLWAGFVNLTNALVEGRAEAAEAILRTQVEVGRENITRALLSRPEIISRSLQVPLDAVPRT